MENRIQTKIDEIQRKIKNNLDTYDLNQVYNLLNDLDNKLVTCVKVDYEILDFFRSKSNFRIIQDLKDFGFTKLKYKVKGKKRIDIDCLCLLYSIHFGFYYSNAVHNNFWFCFF